MPPVAIEQAPEFTTKNSHPVGVVGKNEPWSEYLLADGTVIRARLEVQGFHKFDLQYDANGAPVYGYSQLIYFEVCADPEPELVRRLFKGEGK
jgi:hypothetical protein